MFKVGSSFRKSDFTIASPIIYTYGISDNLIHHFLRVRTPKNPIFLMVSEGYGPISGEKRPILGHIFDRGYIIDHLFKTGFEEKYAGLGGETVGTKTTPKKNRHDCGIFFGNFGSVLGGEMGSRPKSVSPERRTLQ